MRIAAVQHDIVWEDRDANFERLAPQVARAVGGRRRAGAADRDVLHRLLDDAGHRRARGRPVVAVPRRRGPPSTGSGWAARCPEIADGTGGRRGAALQLLRAGRPGRHDAPLPQAAPVHPRRRARALPGGGEAGDRPDRRPAGHPVHLLRPALRRRLLAAPRPRPTSTWCRRTGRARAGCTGRRCCRPARSRTRPTSSGCNRVGTAGDGTEHVGDTRIVSPMGELLATAAGVETIVLADVDAAEVAATRDRLRFLPDRRG